MKKELRLRVYNKCGGHCAYCGKPIKYEAMKVDRIVPRIATGTDELENYNPSCRPCTYRKGRLSVEGFRSEIRHQALHMQNMHRQVRCMQGRIHQA